MHVTQTMTDMSPILAASALNESYDTALAEEPYKAEQMNTSAIGQDVSSFDVDSPSLSNIPKPPSFVGVGAGGKLTIVSPSQNPSARFKTSVYADTPVEPADFGLPESKPTYQIGTYEPPFKNTAPPNRLTRGQVGTYRPLL